MVPKEVQLTFVPGFSGQQHVSLPNDVLGRIFSCLTSEHRARAACVCRNWRATSLLDATVFSVDADFVPGNTLSCARLAPWFKQYGHGLQAVHLNLPDVVDSKFSREVFWLLDGCCPELRILQLAVLPSGTFPAMVNLVTCSITLTLPQPENWWPFAALPNLVHLMVAVEEYTVLYVGELPPSLKTLGCDCGYLFLRKDQPAPHLESLTVKQIESWVGDLPYFARYSTQVPNLQNLFLSTTWSLSRELGQMTNLVRLLLRGDEPEMGEHKCVDLSALTCLRDGILLGAFKVSALPASLQRLVMAWNCGPANVPNLMDCPQLRLVSVIGIVAEEHVAAPPGCVVLKGTDGLFMKAGMIDMAPFQTLLGDLDTRPRFIEAWEALWPV